MPRQPIPRCHHDAGWVIGKRSLPSRPAHAEIIARCLGIWPEIELQLAIMLGVLLKTKSSEAVAVYLTLRRSSSRIDALEAASRGLDEQLGELFKAVMRVVSAAEKERNFLAHGIYAACDQMPDSIACAQQIDLVEWSMERISEGWEGNQVTDKKIASQLVSKLFHYQINDLQEIYGQIYIAQYAAFRFTCLLRAIETEKEELLCAAEYGRICLLPPVQAALIHLRARALRNAIGGQDGLLPQPQM